MDGPVRASSRVSPREAAAQRAWRGLEALCGRLERGTRVPGVARWQDIVEAAEVFLRAVEDAYAEAVANAAAVAKVHREQLLLLPSGTVVDEDSRPPVRRCELCDRESRAVRCLCGWRLR